MFRVKRFLQHPFIRDDSGSTAVEYSVMIALIIVTCIGTLKLFGGTSGNLWASSLSTMESEFQASPGGGS